MASPVTSKTEDSVFITLPFCSLYCVGDADLPSMSTVLNNRGLFDRRWRKIRNAPLPPTPHKKKRKGKKRTIKVKENKCNQIKSTIVYIGNSNRIRKRVDRIRMARRFWLVHPGNVSGWNCMSVCVTVYISTKYIIGQRTAKTRLTVVSLLFSHFHSDFYQMLYVEPISPIGFQPTTSIRSGLQIYFCSRYSLRL